MGEGRMGGRIDGIDLSLPFAIKSGDASFARTKSRQTRSVWRYRKGVEAFVAASGGRIVSVAATG